MRALLIVAGLLFLPGTSRGVEDDLFPAPPFSLTDQNGKTVTNEDLKGKVWVASFVFTRCTAGCPQITTQMKELQDQFRGHPDFWLVTFTIDPTHDSSEELREYAKAYQADPAHWLFLTGTEKELHQLLQKGFYGNLGQKQEVGYAGHENRMFLVDRRGMVRAIPVGIEPKVQDPEMDENERRALQEKMSQQYKQGQQELREKIRRFLGAKPTPIHFPTLNSILNGISGLLIFLGILAIKKKYVRLHKVCMSAAVIVSTVFLASYLYYHIVVMQGASTKFIDRAPDAPTWVSQVYLFILVTHIILAAVITPLALITAYLGLRNKLSRHVKLARYVWPSWLYVSITGVVVYLLLYQTYPPS